VARRAAVRTDDSLSGRRGTWVSERRRPGRPWPPARTPRRARWSPWRSKLESQSCGRGTAEQPAAGRARKRSSKHAFLVRRMSIQGDQNQRHAGHRSDRDRSEQSVVTHFDWAELCPTSVRVCGAPS